MRIVDLLKKESIQLNASPKSKSDAIEMLIDLQVISARALQTDLVFWWVW